MGRFNEDNPPQEASPASIDDGRKYVTSTRTAALTNDGSVEVYFSLDAGADTEDLIVVSWDPSADAEARISTNVDQDGTGSALDVLNAKTAAGNTPTSTVRTGDVYTINGTTLNFNIGGGSNAGAGSGGSASAAGPTTFLLSPGDSLLFELYNRSGGDSNTGISVSWFEVDI